MFTSQQHQSKEARGMAQKPKRQLVRTSTLFAAAVALLVPMSLAGAAPASAASSGIVETSASSPSGLRINGLDRPADLGDLESPAFSWYVPTIEQSAYRVVLATSAETARAGAGDVWDSGKVASATQTDVEYGGQALEPGKRYYWAVQTWDASDAATSFSEPTWFGTAIGADWGGSSPIWAAAEYPGANDGPAWDDYTVDMTIATTVALGVQIRAADAANSYMWQFRADRNQLVPHTQKNGSYTAQAAVDLPEGALQPGVPADVRIEVSGSTITTSIGGVEVDERTDASFPTGTVGLRTGRTESGTVSSLVVTTRGGDTLYAFAADQPSVFPCLSVVDGALSVPTSAACLITIPGSTPITTDWAFLRTEAELRNQPIAEATLFATAGDFRAHKQYVYKAYVNGHFVGLGPTNRIGSESRYDGFDVTELLREGEANAIGVQAYTTGESRQKFIGQLRVTYADGATEIYGTGTDWKALPGSPVLPDAGTIGTSFYAAPKENVDARAFPYGYAEPGYDDSEWAAAVAKPSFTDLQTTPMAKVEQQLHDPVEIVDKGNGNYFVDFGRSWIGGVHYEVESGVAGGRVELRFGEITSSEHSVRNKLNTGNDYTDLVTLADGSQTIETWGMRVFRYVEIVGAPEPITAENLKVLALVYPFDADASSFTSSNDNLNQVYSLAKNSIEALNVNFYTDSWTRERINYEADGYLQLKSSLYLMEDLSLGRYSMNYFENNRTWPTEWPIYVVLAVHDAWRQTGNLGEVERAYEDLKEKVPTRWLDPETGLVGKASGSDGCDSRTDCDIVDWPNSQRDGYQFRHYNTVVNALSYRAMADMSAMADALGRAEEARTYTQQAERLRTAMNEYLFDEENGRYDDGMDAQGVPTGHYALHASAFALAFGVPEPEQTSRVADFVASKGMACSVYCAGFSIAGLFDGGAADAAVAQLTDEGTSSWMGMIELGAGATMEAWHPSQKSNLTYSHPWAASPAFHVPAGLFGIKPIEAGYSTFQVKPQPGGVEQARITVPTVKGSVGAAFDHDAEGRIRMAVQIPGNTSADLVVPVSDGTNTVYLNGQAVEVEPQNGFATLSDVTAGCQFVSIANESSYAGDDYLAGLCTPSEQDQGSPIAPNDDALTDESRGLVQVPERAKRGEQIAVEIGGIDAGERVHVWLFSEPVLLESSTLDSAGRVAVTIPETAELGAHRIAVTDASDAFIGWDDIEVIADPSGGGDSDGGGSEGGNGPDGGGDGAGQESDELAHSGADGAFFGIAVALALAMIGGVILIRRKGRRTI